MRSQEMVLNKLRWRSVVFSQMKDTAEGSLRGSPEFEVPGRGGMSPAQRQVRAAQADESGAPVGRSVSVRDF